MFEKTLKRVRVILFGVLALALVFCLSGKAEAGVKVYGDDDSVVKLFIGGLLQAQGVFEKEGAPDGESMGTNFLLRRMRLMFHGEIYDKVNFFIETDDPNFGRLGNRAGNSFIQDAYFEINFHRAFQLDMGMLLVPFSRHGMQAATALLGLDYHGALLKYPDGAHNVWRDFGIMMRGMPFGDWIEFRLGLFNGVRGSQAIESYAGGEWQGFKDPRNPMGLPRLTARLTFNIFEPEGGPGLGGYFLRGINIAKTDAGIVSTKRALSIGGSFDWQRELNVKWAPLPAGTGMTPDSEAREIDERTDYMAAAADLFWDIPLDDAKLMSLNGQVNFFWYDHGDRDGTSYYDTIGSAAYSGIGLMAEAGFRYDAWQPLLSLEWFESDGAGGNEDIGDLLAIYGGVNWWVYGQNFNVKLKVGGDKRNGADDWGVTGALQGQLFF